MSDRENDRAHFEPRDFVDYHLKRFGLDRSTAGIGKSLLMCWIDPDRHGLVAETKAQVAPVGLYGIATADGVSILKAPVGAPATVMVMEEMHALGVRAFIGVGLCGSLDPALPIGSLVIAGATHRDEGTSYHYLPAESEARPTPAAVAALRQAAGEEIPVVAHWTIDAIYRETKRKIARRMEAGVKTVDMEASAVYAAAAHRGGEAAMLLAVSDELWHPTWRPGFHEDALADVRGRALKIGFDAARNLAGSSKAMNNSGR